MSYINLQRWIMIFGSLLLTLFLQKCMAVVTILCSGEPKEDVFHTCTVDLTYSVIYTTLMYTVLLYYTVLLWMVCTFKVKLTNPTHSTFKMKKGNSYPCLASQSVNRTGILVPVLVTDNCFIF